MVRGRAAHEDSRLAGRPAREHFGQPFRQPQGLRAQGAIQQDVGVFVEERLAGVEGIGAEAGRDVVAVGSGLEVALDLLGPAAIDRAEGRERILIPEGHDDGRRIDAARAAPEDGGHDAPEPLERDGHTPRAFRRGVAEHLEVRGADADPVVSARGRRECDADEEEEMTKTMQRKRLDRHG